MTWNAQENTPKNPEKNKKKNKTRKISYEHQKGNHTLNKYTRNGDEKKW